MFLRKDNKIKWKLLGFATVVVAVLMWLGIVWLDKPLFMLIRDFSCNVFTKFSVDLFLHNTWCWLCVLFGMVFDVRVWLIGMLVILMLVYIKKTITTQSNIRNSKHYINLWAILRDAFDKVKNSNAFYIFCSVFVASVLTKILKLFIGRMRPVFFEAQDITGFFPFVSDWAFNSMPSGHTATTFAGLVMLGMLVPKIKWATWCVSIIIGVSRVCIGAHWPTDVLLGAFIGMVTADFVKAYLKKHVAHSGANVNKI